MSAEMKDDLKLAIPESLVAFVADQIADAVAERVPHRPEPYLTVEEAARHLACGKKRIYELVAQARVHHFRDGRRLLFRRADLDEALREVPPR